MDNIPILLPNFPTLTVKGVSSSSSWIMVAILPMFVSIPVAITTPVPFPKSTLEFMDTSLDCIFSSFE